MDPWHSDSTCRSSRARGEALRQPSEAGETDRCSLQTTQGEQEREREASHQADRKNSQVCSIDTVAAAVPLARPAERTRKRRPCGPSAIRQQSTVHPQQAPLRRKTSQATPPQTTPNHTSLQRSSSSAPPAIAAYQPAQHHHHTLPPHSAGQYATRRTQHLRPSPRRASCIVHQTCAKCPSAASAEGQPARSAHSLTHSTLLARAIHCDCHACRTSNRPRHHAAHLAVQPTVSSASGQPARR